MHLIEESYPLIFSKLKVNRKAVPYSRIVWNLRYKLKISGVAHRRLD